MLPTLGLSWAQLPVGRKLGPSWSGLLCLVEPSTPALFLPIQFSGHGRFSSRSDCNNFERNQQNPDQVWASLGQTNGQNDQPGHIFLSAGMQQQQNSNPSWILAKTTGHNIPHRALNPGHHGKPGMLPDELCANLTYPLHIHTKYSNKVCTGAWPWSLRVCLPCQTLAHTEPWCTYITLTLRKTCYSRFSLSSFSRIRTQITFNVYLQDFAFQVQLLQCTPNMSEESCTWSTWIKTSQT